ncbi:V4R domain-containing protein [Methanocaldococcus lauensis]|uniref:V4R domain-containing protein n=1 Tax=Methanocaldococcus lauensis TaxID=2546128 RepID=A0A8D6PUE1_9EURY|nr:V4R domain-containing protein [Methanocaldococcus lauensis]CAB3287692.1 V4R domain-containing protein [Methanocaldococcus lauensis]
MSTSAMKIIEMLKIIDNRAKFMGIKLNMMKNLLEKYKDNKELLKEVLKITKGTRLHELILEAYPPLETLEKEIEEEDMTITLEESEEEKKAEEFCSFDGYVSIIAYVREYMRKYYFGYNVKKIFYEIGKDYAIKMGINNYDTMINFMNDEFGETHIETSEPLTFIVKNNKEAINCRASEPVCYITAGFIAGCLENITEKKYMIEVTEKKCLAKGDPYCQFIVKKSIRI